MATSWFPLIPIAAAPGLLSVPWSGARIHPYQIRTNWDSGALTRSFDSSLSSTKRGGKISPLLASSAALRPLAYLTLMSNTAVYLISDSYTDSCQLCSSVQLYKSVISTCSKCGLLKRKRCDRIHWHSLAFTCGSIRSIISNIIMRHNQT